MYDRAPRKLTSTVGATPAHVGPGTYGRAQTTTVKQLGDGYAPFNSLSTRDTNLVADSVVIAPGPGQYDPKLPQYGVKGASSLTNKSQRFQTVQSEVPGPGSYDVKTKWAKPDCMRPVLCSAPPTVKKDLDEQAQSSSSHIKFSRLPLAPSIPCPGQAFGYEETDDGSLHRQAPPRRDNTIGPAYYNPAMTDTQTTKTYKGIHWGSMKSGRTNFAGKDGPGPGEYDVRDIKCVKENESLPVNAVKYEAHIPRFTEQIMMAEQRQAKPGPGAYKLKREFEEEDKSSSNKQNQALAAPHPPFLTQSKRFSSTKSEAPPPTTYNDPRGALDSMKKITSLKRNPFGQTAVRFQRDRRAAEAPAPNQYNAMRGLAAESEQKAYFASTLHGAFGSTTERRNPLINRDAVSLPGPGAYQVVDNKEGCPPVNRCVVRASANFVSQSARILKTPKASAEVPPPTAYDVEKAFKKEHKPPRNEEARRRHESFLSAAPRFAPPRDIVVAESDPSNPGPGSYEPRLKSEKGNMLTVRAPRDKPLKEGNPGPGYYDYSPLIMDTVLKGTFNVTLCNPPPPAKWFVDKTLCPNVGPPVLPVESNASLATVAV